MSRARAYVCVKRHVEGRFASFMAGFKAAGFDPIPTEPQGKPRPGDVFCTWNRKMQHEKIAERWERDGGTVLVAENGYVGKDATGEQYYALAKHYHNGAGEWYSNGPERLERLGLAFKPWRTSGEHILICETRGIGPLRFKPPANWSDQVTEQLRQFTNRPVKVRKHPGHWKRLKEHPDISLAKDLANAWACVIWSSAAGLRALVAGIPVIRLGPHWIAAEAAGTRLSEIEAPPMPEREPVFQRLAWAQYTRSEIETGYPFKVLMGAPC